MPEVGGGVAVRWVDPAAPWLAAVGGDPAATTYEAARRRPRRAALRRHQGRPRPRRGVRGGAVPARRATSTSRRRSPSTTTTATCATPAPTPCAYRLTDAPIGERAFWTQLQRDLVDHLTRSLTLEIPTNRDAQAVRPARRERRGLRGPLPRRSPTSAPTRRRPKLRDKYEAKVDQAAARRSTRPRDAADVAERPAGRPASATTCCRRPARSSAACSAGARRAAGCSASSAGPPGAPARRRRPARGSTPPRARSAGCRASCEDVEAELAEELTEIDARWTDRGRADRRRWPIPPREAPTSRSPSSRWPGSRCPDARPRLDDLGPLRRRLATTVCSDLNDRLEMRLRRPIACRWYGTRHPH